MSGRGQKFAKKKPSREVDSEREAERHQRRSHQTQDLTADWSAPSTSRRNKKQSTSTDDTNDYPSLSNSDTIKQEAVTQEKPSNLSSSYDQIQKGQQQKNADLLKKMYKQEELKSSTDDYNDYYAAQDNACYICLCEVEREDSVWQCTTCYCNPFHLACIQSWVKRTKDMIDAAESAILYQRYTKTFAWYDHTLHHY